MDLSFIRSFDFNLTSLDWLGYKEHLFELNIFFLISFAFILYQIYIFIVWLNRDFVRKYQFYVKYVVSTNLAQKEVQILFVVLISGLCCAHFAMAKIPLYQNFCARRASFLLGHPYEHLTNTISDWSIEIFATLYCAPSC